MRAYEVRKPYNRKLSLRDLMRTGNINVALYEVIGCVDTYVALQDVNGRSLSNIDELVIVEEHKVPLYKQAMDMQMGRKPQTMSQTRKILRLKQIAPKEKLYDVYIARV